MENVLNNNESQLYLISVYIVTFNNNVTGADTSSPWGSHGILLSACRLQLCTVPMSAITVVCNTNDHTRFKSVKSACSPLAYAEYDMLSIQPVRCTCLSS
jgi:hypothetical protein